MFYAITDAISAEDTGISDSFALNDVIPNAVSCSIISHELRESRHNVLPEDREATTVQSLPQSLLLVSSGSCVCRVCHTNNSKESLISPCRCKGSLAYVHLSCLERWLNQSCRNHCELCRYQFNAVETPRYRWPESLRIWISHPRNRRHVQSDLLILTLLTVVTMGLVTVCILGMRYFVIEGRKIGISRLWTKGAICFFLTIVVLGYATTVYLLVKDQVSPWYRWWKSTVNVRLVMEQQQQQRQHSQPRQALLATGNFDEESFGNGNAEVNTGGETGETPTSIDSPFVRSSGRIFEGQSSASGRF